jgi:hypothetical protein
VTRQPLRPFVPRLERLEDRTVPSTLTILNNLDSGPGSLRAALASAANGDTIAFAPSLSSKTITLTSGTLSVNTSVTYHPGQHGARRCSRLLHGLSRPRHRRRRVRHWDDHI